MFAKQQLVVYPAQGVGRIERVEKREVGGVSSTFYIVRIVSNNVTLMVPVGNAENVGLRDLCSKETGHAILEALRDRSGFTSHAGQNWNRRHRDYSERLKSGDLRHVALVLRELLLISRDKELSFGERRLLDQAMGLVTLELAHVLGRSQEDVRAEIDEIYADTLQARIKQPA